MTQVLRLDGALCFYAGMQIDADGSPRAYHPESSKGLDSLANAGKAGNWYGLVCDSSGVPIIQRATDPAPGFLVSPTALFDRTKSVSDPERYVDSSTVPYISMPPDLKTKGVSLGDLAVVGYKGLMWPAIVADIGPHGRYGEGSIALAQKLSIPASARNGGVDSGVTYVVFPESGKGWPRDFEDDAMDLLYKWGGANRLGQLFPLAPFA